MYFLLPLLIYFPRLLPGIETQPYLVLVASLWFLFFSRALRPRVCFLLLLLLVVVLAALRVAAGLGMGSSLALLQLLVGPLFFFAAVAASGSAALPSLSTLRTVTMIMLALAVIEVVLPGLYLAVASVLLDRATVTDGHRGLSFLTPEPTYAAISLVYLLLLTVWARPPGERRMRWLEPLQFLLLAATLSTYAIMIIGVLLLVWRPRLMAAALAALVLLVPSLSFLNGGDGGLRFVVAISSIIAADFSTFLPSLSVIDPSLGSRVLTNSASFQTPLFAPLGLGLDCRAVPSAFEQLGYSFAFTNEVLEQVIAGGCVKPQSFGATVFLGLGYMALPFLAVLAVAVRASISTRIRVRLWYPALAVALLMLLVQAQLTNPIPWMLLALALTRFQLHPRLAPAAPAPAPVAAPH